MNQKAFNNMSAEDQQVFMDAAAAMADETNASLRSTDEEFYNQLVGDTYGLTECYLDNDQLREMTQAVYDNHPEYADFVAAVRAKAGN
jgi:TRAP-type C4-dicarboxylate transport system substrate-binding protein